MESERQSISFCYNTSESKAVLVFAVNCLAFSLFFFFFFLFLFLLVYFKFCQYINSIEIWKRGWVLYSYYYNTHYRM